MEPIGRFCTDEHELHLIEDCAQAIGATYRGRSVGSFGTGCFLAPPSEDLGCVRRRRLHHDRRRKPRRLAAKAPLARASRSGPRRRSPSENARLDTLQAAILNVKLPHLNDWTAARRRHGAAYQKALQPYFELTAVTESCEPSFSAFVIRHDERDDLIASSRGGVSTPKCTIRFPFTNRERSNRWGRSPCPTPNLSFDGS